MRQEKAVKKDKTILVTGAAGMIGSYVVQGLLDKGYSVIGLDRKEQQMEANQDFYEHLVIDLSDISAVEAVFKSHIITHVIHLAALAHTAGEVDLSWEKYYQVNVVNSRSVFKPAAERNIPILFSSTADVYGIVDGVATAETVLHPVGSYGKSKAAAERELKKICQEASDSPYTIFRFAPVYTQAVKRDIHKRYYLKYPNLAYIVGRGTEYEVLDVRSAVEAVLTWVEKQQTGIWNIRHDKLLNTAECIETERAEGRAKTVLRLPRWLAQIGFHLVRLLLGKDNPKVYLLNKVVNPIRTDRTKLYSIL